jgi:hypothetical protein
MSAQRLTIVMRISPFQYLTAFRFSTEAPPKVRIFTLYIIMPALPEDIASLLTCLWSEMLGNAIST